jgi:phage terminase small subunit
VVAEYALEAHHQLILGTALEALDRMRAAQAEIAADGITVPGRFGPRPAPAVAIERDSRMSMLRALRDLGLDLEVSSGRARTEAARAVRWP